MTDDEEEQITSVVKRLLNDALERADESPLPDPAGLEQRRVRLRRSRHATPQVMTWRADLHPGDLGRPAPGDAAGPARVRTRRGRRRLRRLQGDARLPGGVRAVAGSRHSALGDGDRGRGDRRGADGAAPGRRDAVRRLHLLRLGPPRHRRGQAVLPRANARADRRPPAVGRRPQAALPLPNPELVRAHLGLKIVCPATPHDAKGLLATSIEDRTRFSTSSTSTCTAASRARCRRSATRSRSARRASTAKETTPSS